MFEEGSVERFIHLSVVGWLFSPRFWLTHEIRLIDEFSHFRPFVERFDPLMSSALATWPIYLPAKEAFQHKSHREAPLPVD